MTNHETHFSSSEILEKHGINKTEAEADAKNLTNKANEKISEENNNNKTNVTTIGPVKPPAKKDDDKNGASMLALASSSSSVLSLSVAVALIFSAIV